MTVTSGRIAGIAASFSPVNGHSMNLIAVVLRQVGSHIAAQEAERQMRGSGGIGGGHAGMRVLFELERSAASLLHRVAQAMQRADAGIAAPGKHQLRGAAGADQLIVDQVGRHADQRQIAPALADDLVSGGERNQVSEAFQRHDVAVMNHFLDRLLEWK